MKKNNPLITVILPFFNAEDTLETALKSIAEQSFENFECIMVNNNSSDSSCGIAEDWCEKDHRFRLITEKKQGVSYANNTAVHNSKTALIARMDADDYSMQDRLQKQFDYLDKHKDCDIVAGCVEYIPHKDNLGGFQRFVDWNNSLIEYEQISISRFVELPVINPTLMWRKNIGEKYGFNKHGDFPEDYEMILRWLENGAVIEKLKDIVLKWYDSDKRLSRTDPRYSYDSFLKIKTKYLVNWLKKNNPKYPEIAVWGASRTSRKRLNELLMYGTKVKYYIDIRKNRQLDHKVVFYEDIPGPGTDFILVYIKHNAVRNEINDFLTKKGYVEGDDYLLVS